jgi:predicted transcriptional regulator
MSIISTSTAYRGALDHFEPENALDPVAQRRLRGHLEQIDYTTYAANQAVLKQSPGALDLAAFQRLAVAAALARALWVKTAMEIADAGGAPTRQQVATLADHRAAFEEMREAYEALRRMVERGYLPYRPGV